MKFTVFTKSVGLTCSVVTLLLSASPMQAAFADPPPCKTLREVNQIGKKLKGVGACSASWNGTNCDDVRREAAVGMFSLVWQEDSIIILRDSCSGQALHTERVSELDSESKSYSNGKCAIAIHYPGWINEIKQVCEAERKAYLDMLEPKSL